MAGGNGLNTLEYAQKLKDAGVPAKQAEAQAFVLYEIINSDLATRRDIEEIRAELKRDIKELELKIELAKKDLKIWMGGIAVGGIGLLVALGKLGLLTPAF